MEQFVGHKAILARAMTLGAYNAYRGWTMPENEDPDAPGYLVEYTDGGKPNHKDHAGYISWSPKEQFERSYHRNGELTFGDAIHALKSGLRVTRSGWNGKGMWLSLTKGQMVPAGNFWSQHNADFARENGGQAEVQPYITMKTAQGKIVPWLASQSDMLDNDWMVI